VNGIADPNVIRAGARLTLPGSTGRAAPRPSTSSRRHRIAAGETLSAVAARFGVTVSALASANSIADPNVVRAGAVLRVPTGPGSARPARSAGPAAAPATGGGRHRVAAGDTLGRVAARYGVSVAALASANGIADPNLIVAGSVLTIPTAGELPPVGATTRPRTDLSRPGAVPRQEVSRLLDSYANRHGVDRGLVRAIAWQESGFQQTALSSAGAVGVMQLMPATARWVGSDLMGRPIDPTNVADNVEGGVVLLKWLSSRADDQDQAIAAYYQGLHSVRTRGLYQDTVRYVRSVRALSGRV
jgi:LysM repeat protein